MKSFKTTLFLSLMSLFLVNCGNKEKEIREKKRQDEKCKHDFIMSVSKECAEAKVVYELDIAGFLKKSEDESLDCNALRELYNTTIRQPMKEMKPVLDTELYSKSITKDSAGQFHRRRND